MMIREDKLHWKLCLGVASRTDGQTWTAGAEQGYITPLPASASNRGGVGLRRDGGGRQGQVPPENGVKRGLDRIGDTRVQPLPNMGLKLALICSPGSWNGAERSFLCSSFPFLAPFLPSFLPPRSPAWSVSKVPLLRMGTGKVHQSRCIQVRAQHHPAASPLLTCWPLTPLLGFLPGRCASRRHLLGKHRSKVCCVRGSLCKGRLGYDTCLGTHPSLRAFLGRQAFTAAGGRGDLLSHPLRYKPPLCSVLPKHDCLIPTTSPGEKRWHHNICSIWYKTDCSSRHKVYVNSRTSQNDFPRPQYVNVSSTERVSLSLKLRSREWASPLQLCES